MIQVSFKMRERARAKNKTLSHRCRRGRPSRWSAHRAMECLRQDRCTPGTAWGDRGWEPGSCWSPGRCDRLRVCSGHTNQIKLPPSLFFISLVWPVHAGEGHDQFGLPDWTIAQGLTVFRDGDGWEGLRLLGETLEMFERGRRRGCLHVDHGRKIREEML